MRNRYFTWESCPLCGSSERFPGVSHRLSGIWPGHWRDGLERNYERAATFAYGRPHYTEPVNPYFVCWSAVWRETASHGCTVGTPVVAGHSFPWVIHYRCNRCLSDIDRDDVAAGNVLRSSSENHEYTEDWNHKVCPPPGELLNNAHEIGNPRASFVPAQSGGSLVAGIAVDLAGAALEGAAKAVLAVAHAVGEAQSAARAEQERKIEEKRRAPILRQLEKERINAEQKRATEEYKRQRREMSKPRRALRPLSFLLLALLILTALAAVLRFSSTFPFDYTLTKAEVETRLYRVDGDPEALEARAFITYFRDAWVSPTVTETVEVVAAPFIAQRPTRICSELTAALIRGDVASQISDFSGSTVRFVRTEQDPTVIAEWSDPSDEDLFRDLQSWLTDLPLRDGLIAQPGFSLQSIRKFLIREGEGDSCLSKGPADAILQGL